MVVRWWGPSTTTTTTRSDIRDALWAFQVVCMCTYRPALRNSPPSHRSTRRERRESGTLYGVTDDHTTVSSEGRNENVSRKNTGQDT
jgi:hypothetical protein